MEIVENVPLAPYTTFSIGGPARYFCVVKNEAEIDEALTFATNNRLKLLFLGGGSNMLISDLGFNGLVVKVETNGIEKLFENSTEAVFKVGSGENWDSFVESVVNLGLWGVENLSHIPGLTGGIAVQNVGAYGQEASEVIKEVEVYDSKEQKITTISNADCLFTYRHSIFNTRDKDRYVILYLTFVLKKQGSVNTAYGDMKKYFEGKDTSAVTSKQAREAIIEIRNRKFPFPDSPEKGNAGSFFRGELLNKINFEKLIEKIRGEFGESFADKLAGMADKLEVPQGYKTPAAFLIDICGFKGEKVGGAMVNPTQPAIILNFTGKATSEDVMNLFEKVKTEVYKKTGVTLDHEPEFVGF